MKESTKDQAAGTAKDLKGKTKEAIGNVTNNSRLRAEGQADQVEGKVQKKAGEIKKVFNQ